VTVSVDACLKVDDAYPEWWVGKLRTMKLETVTGNYPVPFS